MEKILKDIARSLKSIDDSLKKIEKGLSREIIVNVDGCITGDDVVEKIEEELKKARKSIGVRTKYRDRWQAILGNILNP